MRRPALEGEVIEALGAVLRDFFTVVGVIALPAAIGRALLMRGRRSVTMAGRK